MEEVPRGAEAGVRGAGCKRGQGAVGEWQDHSKHLREMGFAEAAGARFYSGAQLGTSEYRVAKAMWGGVGYRGRGRGWVYKYRGGGGRQMIRRGSWSS